MSVTLVKHYDPAWPSWFEALRHRFDSVLSGRYCSIEHVGSTSVAGMTAKPIIDVDIVIEPQDFESTKDRLAEIGYFHEGDKGIPGRDAFDLSDSELKESLPAHHTYVCDKYGAALKRHLVFRDFLRLNPEYARRFSTLKWQLAEEHDNDRQSYMDGKVALCEEIYEQGLEALECRRSLYLPFKKKTGKHYMRVVHHDGNIQRVRSLFERYGPGAATVEHLGDECLLTLRSHLPHKSTDELIAEFEIEPMRDYLARVRRDRQRALDGTYPTDPD